MIKDKGPMGTPTYVRFTDYQLNELKSIVERGDYMTISEAVRAAVTSMFRGNEGANSGKKKENTETG